MKKWKTLVAAGLVGSMLAAGTAQAESEIEVFVEGSPISFQKAPFVADGTTLVPFRALFESLGLTVEWHEETRTIFGAGDDIEILLQLDNKTAVVNGEEIALSQAPRSIDGSTFVPLRFVGEATGREVNWEESTRTIAIGAEAGAAVGFDSDFDFAAFYDAFVAASNAEDAEAVMAAIHPDATFLGEGVFEAQLIDSYEKYDVVTELESFEVVDANAAEVTLLTVESNVNTNDAFHMDSRMELLLTLVPDEDGAWKIYHLEPLELEYIVPEDVLTGDSGLGAAAEKRILDVVVKNLEATEAEDMEAMLETIDPSSPAAVQTEVTMEFIFSLYDLDYEIELNNVVHATNDAAFVYTIQTTEKLDGEEFIDNRIKAVQELRKQPDGSWKLYMTYLISAEPLE